MLGLSPTSMGTEEEPANHSKLETWTAESDPEATRYEIQARLALIELGATPRSLERLVLLPHADSQVGRCRRSARVRPRTLQRVRVNIRNITRHRGAVIDKVPAPHDNRR